MQLLVPQQKQIETTKNLYAPIGLGMGAETPEEIALAIVAEIKVILSGSNGASLREKNGSIHSPIQIEQANNFLKKN